MRYLKTLASIDATDTPDIGKEAADLATLHRDQTPMPHTVVVLGSCFDKLIADNGLKYKIDYILSHSRPEVPQSMTNAYTGARKAIMDAKLPQGFEDELKEMVESITAPSADIAVRTAAGPRPPLRIIMSLGHRTDPEQTVSVVQMVHEHEIVQGVREAWALAYHPEVLAPRMREHLSENNLKVALIIQAMDKPEMTIHAYTCVQQDHHKIYLQCYLGYPDLRERIAKDYYAVGKSDLRIAATDIREQPTRLEEGTDGTLVATPFTGKSAHDRLIQREIEDVARVVKKAERTIGTPLKLYLARTGERTEVLWCKRLGFEIMMEREEN